MLVLAKQVLSFPNEGPEGLQGRLCRVLGAKLEADLAEHLLNYRLQMMPCDCNWMQLMQTKYVKIGQRETGRLV
jgi:hypothetical protein